MKIQLLIASLFVVATFAESETESETKFEVRRLYRERHPNDIRKDTTDLGNPKDEAKTENEDGFGRGRTGLWRQRNGERHHHFTHDPEWHQRHGIPMPNENTEGERKHLLFHRFHHHKNRTTVEEGTGEIGQGNHHTDNPEWHKRHEIPMPDENTVGEGRHHWFHHFHHHHHHKNSTTSIPSTSTVTPLTTTLSSATSIVPRFTKTVPRWSPTIAPRWTTTTVPRWTTTTVPRRVTTVDPEYSREILDTNRVDTEFDDTEMIMP